MKVTLEKMSGIVNVIQIKKFNNTSNEIVLLFKNFLSNNGRNCFCQIIDFGNK